MIQTIHNFTKPMDLEATILEFDFDDSLLPQLVDRIQFDEEDSGVAPGPSVGCSLRSNTMREFEVIYLQYCHRLQVYGERTDHPEILADLFLAEFPELENKRRFK